MVAVDRDIFGVNVELVTSESMCYFELSKKCKSRKKRIVKKWERNYKNYRVKLLKPIIRQGVVICHPITAKQFDNDVTRIMAHAQNVN